MSGMPDSWGGQVSAPGAPWLSYSSKAALDFIGRVEENHGYHLDLGQLGFLETIPFGALPSEGAERPLDCSTRNCATEPPPQVNPPVFSWEAEDDIRWKRIEARRSNCRSADGPQMGLFRPSDGKTVVSACACHTKLHDGCRPSDLEESIIRLTQETVAGYQLPSLLTLTARSDRNRMSRDRAILGIWKRWRIFLDRARSCKMRRRHGRETPCCQEPYQWTRPRYVAVVELHKSGWPHIHAVMNTCPWETRSVKRTRPDGTTYQVWEASGSAAEHVKRAWVSVGGGYEVKWEVLAGTGTYVAKYVTKAESVPRDVLAMMSVNGRRWYNRSPGLKPPKVTTWEGFRGKAGEVEAWLSKKTNPEGLTREAAEYTLEPQTGR